jgi:hypothetical protein
MNSALTALETLSYTPLSLSPVCCMSQGHGSCLTEPNLDVLELVISFSYFLVNHIYQILSSSVV